MKYYIGWDNGINGGIVILDKNENIVAKHIMPTIGKTRKEYDINSIIEILRLYEGKDVLGIVEKAQPQFRDGSKQAFKTGFGYCIPQVMFAMLNIPYEIVSAKIWQKNIFKGLDTKDTKSASILYCQRKYPSEDWTPTLRAKKCHDGLTDATCMALYGIRCLNN